MIEIETNPFSPFIPAKAKVLIIGSFPGREQTQGINDTEQWFYGARRNQFWKILSQVYQTELTNKASKQNLFNQHGIGITDILLKVRRKNNSNLDNNLEILEYNEMAIREILNQFNFSTIFFTSRFVGKHFVKLFPEIKNIDFLPSPSPRYAKMKLSEKIDQYRIKLPRLDLGQQNKSNESLKESLILKF